MKVYCNLKAILLSNCLWDYSHVFTRFLRKLKLQHLTSTCKPLLTKHHCRIFNNLILFEPLILLVWNSLSSSIMTLLYRSCITTMWAVCFIFLVLQDVKFKVFELVNYVVPYSNVNFALIVMMREQLRER